MSTQPGSVLINNRYDLVRVLGRGSTGTVYLAYDTQLDRDVAIKLLNEKAIANSDIVARFAREIQITARLQHPGVVAVFEKADSSDGLPCCVMSLAIGETLEEYIEFLGRQEDHWRAATLIDRLTLFLKVLDVVSYAHSQGVVHRDLKPANIVLGEYGEVHVLDWGLARSLVDEDEEQVDEYEDLFEFDALPAAGQEAVPLSERHPPMDISGADTLVDEVVDGRHSDRSIRRRSSDRLPAITDETGTRTTGMTTVGDEDYHPDDLQRNLSDGITRFDASSAARPVVPPKVQEPSRLIRTESAAETVHQSTDPGSNTGSRGRETARISVHHRSDTGRQETSSRHRQDSTSRSRRKTGTSSRYRVATRSGRYGSSIGDSGRSTRYGDVLGSPVYMSPEQARGEAGTADERADVYALGVLLVELLSLHPPLEQVQGELLLQFIERVRQHDGWRNLKDLWPEAPLSLRRICERALAYHPDDRYRHCEQFRRELSDVLDQLSASFSELERQRLQREREGAWLPVGHWNYLHQMDTAPFSEAVTAYEGEPVGQVLHPEMGGLLVGGTGMQVYPVSLNVADDTRVIIDFSITGGCEFWVYMRGVPPTSAYAFRIGAWNGRWFSIVQTRGLEDLFYPSSLTMMPISSGRQSTAFSGRDHIRRRRLILEVVGSSLRMQLDEEELTYHDPCPLLGPEHQQIGIATKDSQLIIHELIVERRLSPLMVPSYHIANELLRQQMYPPAITFFQRFLTEHQEDEELRSEAHFMLCLAFLRAGYAEQAEKELHRFIMERLEHALSQDAVYELAKLRVGDSSNIGPGVRVVLSYQETGDQSRSRFSMWAVQVLSEAIREDGITADVEESLQLLKHLIQGFSDERLLLDTASFLLSRPMQAFAVKLFDLQAFEDLYRFQQRIGIICSLGYRIELPSLHTPSEYIDTARQLRSLDLNDQLDQRLLGEILGQYRSVRDLICLSSYGCSQELVFYLTSQQADRPSIKLLEAGLLIRNGREDAAAVCLEACFALMDKIESERTDIEIATISRLAMFALGYLPWDVAWEPIAVLNNNADLQAIAAWLAESFGHREAAIHAYRLLHSSLGSGFRMVAEQGLARLQMQADLG